MSKDLKKLHLGCGRDILQGWINLDAVPLEGVDVVANLDECRTTKLPFWNDSIDEFLANHVIEHLHNCLPFMEELYRIAKPNAKAVFRVPYGSSDDAFEDPTHRRQLFLNSFQYFSQPLYWRADYGYRGDWLTEKIELIVEADRHQEETVEEIMWQVHTFRNIVKEMVVELRAIKPIREPNKELQIQPKIEIILASTY
jgi:SAM-dependent methyltransferase